MMFLSSGVVFKLHRSSTPDVINIDPAIGSNTAVTEVCVTVHNVSHLTLARRTLLP